MTPIESQRDTHDPIGPTGGFADREIPPALCGCSPGKGNQNKAADPAGASKSQRDISDPVPLPVAVKIVRCSCHELVLVDDLYPCRFRYAGTLRHPHYRRRQG